MVSINKSFLYGIGFASVTWIISLYLYSQLTKKDSSAYSTVFPSANQITSKSEPKKIHNFKDELKEQKQAFKNYIVSKNLLKELQPVRHKALSEEEQALNELGMVRTSEDKKVKEEGQRRHAFNVLISNRLSYHRNIPDTRHKLCKSAAYPDELPDASIIICFYNEHNHTLLRTVHSILDRTQPSVLKEIILVDDFSDLPNLNGDLQRYIRENLDGNVRLYKTERREGLIRARIFGARKASGKVIVFLDSHVEVNADWLRPLLSRIKEKRTNVVTPIIDIINADTFSYTSSPLVRGGFNWGLHFKWENLPTGTLSKEEDFVKPIKSPTMAGGLFAIDRQYFIDLGEYDAGMNIWGGENLEISFRIWMCGGQLELIPCSRVGHVFRHRRPYGSPDGQDTMLHNSLRVAHVWMDDYKEYFFKQNPGAKKINYNDISSRIQLRKELKCHDFGWYLKYVYPEMVLPSDDEQRQKQKWSALEQGNFQPWHSRQRNYVAHYQIRLTNTTLCVQSSTDVKTKGSALVLKTCLRSKNQIWYQTDRNELVLAQLLCLQSAQPNPYLYKCHEMGGDQEWKHKGENKTPIYNLAAGTCLGVNSKEIGATVTMKLCAAPSSTVWDLVR